MRIKKIAAGTVAIALVTVSGCTYQTGEITRANTGFGVTEQDALACGAVRHDGGRGVVVLEERLPAFRKCVTDRGYTYKSTGV